jgi:hypothetical protein
MEKLLFHKVGIDTIKLYNRVLSNLIIVAVIDYVFVPILKSFYGK